MGGGDSRLSPLPPLLDVGEQVFGSSHVFDLPAPFNRMCGPAKLIATIAEGTPFSVESCLPWLVQVGSMSADDLREQLANPVRVRFSPRGADFKHQTFNGDLWLTATWPDGHVETGRVSLVGGGRELADVPSPTRAEREAAAHDQKAEQAEEATANAELAAFHANSRKDGPPADAARRFDDAYDAAAISAADLARHQRTGANVLQAEIATYKAPRVEREVWWDIAKAAITLGTAVLATYVGGAVASALVKSVEEGGSIALEKMTSGGVRDALKQAATASLEAVHGAADNTSNTSVAFLKAQLDTLDKMETANAHIAKDHHTRHFLLLYSKPEVAVAMMEAVDHAFSQSAEAAEAAQLAASAGAWLAFKARMSAGATTLGNQAPSETEVTDLSRAAGKSIAGVLEIRVNIESGNPRVNDVRVVGVAQAVADHLGDLDLRVARIPLKISVGWNEPNPTIITRDEAGRLTVTGDFKRLALVSSDHEPIDDASQADLAAREMTDIVTSRTLSNWGVSVSTDDQSATEGT